MVPRNIWLTMQATKDTLKCSAWPRSTAASTRLEHRFGVSASDDDGQTWSQVGGGLSNVTPAQVINRQNALLAATSNGVYRFPLAPATPASLGCWMAVLTAVVVFGATGILLAGFDRLPWPRERRST